MSRHVKSLCLAIVLIVHSSSQIQAIDPIGAGTIIFSAISASATGIAGVLIESAPHTVVAVAINNKNQVDLAKKVIHQITSQGVKKGVEKVAKSAAKKVIVKKMRNKIFKKIVRKGVTYLGKSLIVATPFLGQAIACYELYSNGHLLWTVVKGSVGTAQATPTEEQYTSSTRDSQDPVVDTTRGCGSSTPQVVSSPSGCGETTPIKQSVSGCGDTQPQVNSVSGCGDTQPVQLNATMGCGEIKPVSSETNVLKRLSEQEVRVNYGDKFKELNVISPEQKQLDHVTSGHIAGGSRVHSNPTKPKTLFSSEDELMDIAIESIKNGKIVEDGENGKVLVHDFGRTIGKTIAGELLTKAKVVLCPGNNGSLKFVTMYPIK